ncbi:hypothetical protein PHYPSEUDO_003141 [Phytophthora pseudosyringae]|uniref:Uncharacterized protein n=1 Tax=Phytophthora pseudosyringae TaxID=221518 RepID=A0A8T1WFG2_9STRA|nr:hypothetical protein PHYPSEUDO_003141 [Phytophthora pseudosyringae]
MVSSSCCPFSKRSRIDRHAATPIEQMEPLSRVHSRKERAGAEFGRPNWNSSDLVLSSPSGLASPESDRFQLEAIDMAPATRFANSAASSSRSAPDAFSSLLVAELHATAGLRATIARLMRVEKTAVPPRAVRSSPIPSPVASPAAASEGSDASADAFQEQLVELRFDAVMEINSSTGVADEAVVASADPSASSDPGSTLPVRPVSPTESASGLFDDDSDGEDLVVARELRRLQRGSDSA